MSLEIKCEAYDIEAELAFWVTIRLTGVSPNYSIKDYQQRAGHLYLVGILVKLCLRRDTFTLTCSSPNDASAHDAG